MSLLDEYKIECTIKDENSCPCIECSMSGECQNSMGWKYPIKVDFKNPDGKWRIEVVHEEYISMCSEFDSYDGPSEWDKMYVYRFPYADEKPLVINTEERAQEIREFISRWPEEVKTELKQWIDDYIPYEYCTAEEQKQRDKDEQRYPNPDSKYAVELTKKEIDEIILQIQIETAENVNDWRVYRDREPGGYRGKQRNKVVAWQDVLKKKEKMLS